MLQNRSAPAGWMLHSDSEKINMMNKTMTNSTVGVMSVKDAEHGEFHAAQHSTMHIETSAEGFSFSKWIWRI